MNEDIHIIGILRDFRTKEFRSYTAIPVSKSLEEVQKLVEEWNNSNKDSTYTLSQDKDLIDIVKHVEKEPDEVFLEAEIRELDRVIESLEYERSNLQSLQDKRDK